MKPFLLGLLLLVATGCSKVCRPNTVLLQFSFGSAGASISSATVTVIVDGSAVTHQVAVDKSSGSIEVVFPSGYPKGKSVEFYLQLFSLDGTTLIARRATAVLDEKCAIVDFTLSSPLDLASTDQPDDLGVVDLLTMPDLSVGPTPDMVTVEDLTGVGPCTVSENACLDATTLKSCREDGLAFENIACAAGCSMTGAPHCRLIVPTPPVTTTDLTLAGTVALELTSGEILLSADDGSITGAITRPANSSVSTVEVLNGIGFHVAGGVGIFSFKSISIAEGATVRVYGTQPVALVSARGASIKGVIDARGYNAAGQLCSTRNGGPGASAGGAAGTVVTGMPQAGSSGSGAGAGGGGGGAMQGLPGGGGGAGHFAAGAAGSRGCHNDSPSVSAGTSGPSYSAAFQAGSGGGGAGANGGAAGGGGGGAVQFVAAGLVSIGNGTTAAGLNVGGCGGFGGGNGGGGGGSGGAILIEAPTVQVVVLGTLASNGGGGGGAGTNRDGRPGTLDASPALGGGSSSTGGLKAGNGGAGDLPAGGSPVALCEGAGYGGGGAAGTIKINTVDPAPTINTQAVLSPSATSGGTTFAVTSAQ